MSVTAETVSVLFLLMPGFIASRVLDTAITRKDQGAAGKIVEALIFSFLIYAISQFYFEWTPLVVSTNADAGITYQFTQDYGLVAFVLVASIAIPAVVGACIHHDAHTAVLRWLKVTDKTSRSSVWQDVYISETRHVVVHLTEGRRIYGWPMYFSHDPTGSYIYLFQPAWLTKEGEYLETETHGILIKNDMIRYIEFMKKPEEDLKKVATGTV